jgi:hypothetical protein
MNVGRLEEARLLVDNDTRVRGSWKVGSIELFDEKGEIVHHNRRY